MSSVKMKLHSYFVMTLMFFASANVSAESVKQQPLPKRQVASIATKNEAVALEKYLQCQPTEVSETAYTNSKTCSSALLDASESSSRRDRLSAWLLLKYEVFQIRDCKPNELKRIASFRDRKPNFVCFEFADESDLHVGFAFFTKSGETLKLYSLHY